MAVNPYLPVKARIEEVRPEIEDTRTITVRPQVRNAKSMFVFEPGQFLQVTAFGVGEAPISICSSPRDSPSMQMSIRKIGSVTEALNEARVGDFIGLRGPYGNGWPMEKLRENDVVLVAGGIGMAPLRSLMLTLPAEKDMRRTTLCYGARNSSLLMYQSEYADWAKAGATIRLTVDQGDSSWKGNVGVVTNLLENLDADREKAVACICGPPVMIKFSIRKLAQLGYKPDNIYASLESMMRCGIGKCGHCHFGDKHVCIDGPVFSYVDIQELPKGLAPI